MFNADGNSIRELSAMVRERELQFRTVFDCALDAMLIANDQGRYLDANPAALALLGVSREQLLSMGIADILANPGPGLTAMWSAFIEAGHSQGEIELRRADGAICIAEFRATANIVPGMHLSVIRDLTERRRAEETRLLLLAEQRALEARLAIADRMSTVGTLAAGIAHEINNPIMAVVANLELAQQELTQLPEGAQAQVRLRSLVGEALEATARVTGIVRDVKLLSRVTEPRQEAIDVHRVLESALRIASNEIRHRARVVRDYGTVPAVWGDESRLGQVFLNLIVNAAQAIPEGHADQHEIRLRTRLAAGRDRVEVEVEDTGAGIAPDARSNLFKPFFTTRAEGQGTGLGLAICHRIVAELGGEIEVPDGVGATIFRVSLPVAQASEQRAPASAAPQARKATRRGRVMLVDDDLSICRSIEYFLRGENDVSLFSTGRDALAVLAAGARYDVILCDLMMPVMTGMELHRALLRLDPQQASRMVFLTGGAFTAEAQSFLEQIANERLEKPFSLRTLALLVTRKVAELEG